MTRRFASRSLSLRTAILVLAAAAAVLVAARLDLGAQQQPAQERLLLTGARVLDTAGGRYVSAPAVILSGGKVESILSAVPGSVPSGTRRIDLNGLTLVPGLGDMFATEAADASADADFYYAMALAHGVTTFRVVGGRLPWLASQRDRSNAGDVLAPRLWVGGPRFDQAGLPSFTVQHIADAASAGRAVAQQRSFGADWISMAGGVPPELSKAILKAARTQRLRVGGEPGLTPVAELIRTGVDAIERLGFMSRNRQDLVKELSSKPDAPTDPDALADGTWLLATAADLAPEFPRATKVRPAVIPMLASYGGTLDAEGLARDPAAGVLPARWRDALTKRAHPANWPGAKAAARAAEIRGRQVAAFAAAGAPIVTGVDAQSTGYSIPGAGIHREMSLLVAAGLTPADAIRAATVNCGTMLGAAGIGRIQPGGPADLFAVEGDPLAHVEDLLRIKLVVRAGELLDRAQLLGQAKHAAR